MDVFNGHVGQGFHEAPAGPLGGATKGALSVRGGGGGRGGSGASAAGGFGVSTGEVGGGRRYLNERGSMKRNPWFLRTWN